MHLSQVLWSFLFNHCPVTIFQRVFLFFFKSSAPPFTRSTRINPVVRASDVPHRARAWPCFLFRREKKGTVNCLSRLDSDGPRDGYLGQRGLTEGASHARLGHEPRPSDLLTISIARAVRSPPPPAPSAFCVRPKQAPRRALPSPPFVRPLSATVSFFLRSFCLSALLPAASLAFYLSLSWYLPLFVLLSTALLPSFCLYFPLNIFLFTDSLYPQPNDAARAQVKDALSEARESLNKERGGESRVYFGIRYSLRDPRNIWGPLRSFSMQFAAMGQKQETVFWRGDFWRILFGENINKKLELCWWKLNEF